jgi:hypothetical protein
MKAGGVEVAVAKKLGVKKRDGSESVRRLSWGEHSGAIECVSLSICESGALWLRFGGLGVSKIVVRWLCGTSSRQVLLGSDGLGWFGSLGRG